MQDARDLYAIGRWGVEDDVPRYRKTAHMRRQFRSCAAHHGLPGQVAATPTDVFEQRVSGADIVHGDVEPDFIEITFGLGRLGDEKQGHLSTLLCSSQHHTASKFDVLDVELTCRAALQTFLDVLPEL